MRVLGPDERDATVNRVHSVVRQLPRCAALTVTGTQCKGCVGSTGEGGGWVMLDGKATPFCTVHFKMAQGTLTV